MDKKQLEQIANVLHMSVEEVQKYDFHLITAKNGEVLGAYAPMEKPDKDGVVNNPNSFLVNLTEDKTVVLGKYTQQKTDFSQIQFLDKDGKVIPLSDATKNDKDLNLNHQSEINGMTVKNPQEDALTVFAPLGGSAPGIHIGSRNASANAFQITPITEHFKKVPGFDVQNNRYLVIAHGDMALSAANIIKDKDDMVVVAVADKSSLVFEEDKGFQDRFEWFRDEGTGTIFMDKQGKFVVGMPTEHDSELFLKYNGVTSPVFTSKDVLRNKGFVVDGGHNFEANTLEGKLNYFFHDIREKEGRLDEPMKDKKGAPIYRTFSNQQGYNAEVDTKLGMTANEMQRYKKLMDFIMADGKETDAEKQAMSAVKDILIAHGDQLKHDPKMGEKIGELFANTGNDVSKVKGILGL
jgi:hypothetical protein